MEQKFKKLLIGFFVFMLVFTFISRAAASLTVAQVTTAYPKRGSLFYQQVGTGTIKENAEKYIKIEAGYIISKIYKKSGDTVNKEDLLFAYDVNHLEDLLKTKETELKKLNLTYDKNNLSSESTDSTVDMELAILQEENAKTDFDQSIQNLKQAKEDVKKRKEKEYKEALSSLQEQKTGKSNAIRSLNRQVEDTQSALDKLKEPILKMEDVLTVYKNAVLTKKEETIDSAYRVVFKNYYGSKYEEHKQQIDDAEKNLARLKEDLTETTRKWETLINEFDYYSPDESIKNAYLQQVYQRNSEIKACNRAIEDAQKALDKLKEEDNLLDSILKDYASAIEKNDPTLEQEVYQKIYNLIYEHVDISKEDILKAEAQVKRAKEDVQAAEKEWNKKIEDAQEKVDSLSSDLQAIANNSYDYSDDIKEDEKSVEQAKRTLESANLQREKQLDEINTKENNEKTSKTAQELEQEMLQLDITAKKEEIRELKKLIKNKGEILSPVDGIVGTSTLESGITLSGNEKYIIHTGGFELVMKAPKDNLKYFSVGDHIGIKNYDSPIPFSSNIETMGLPDEEGLITFTALLPDGNYKNGGSLDYELKKSSSDYPYCVPLQAIRQEFGQTYVLVIKEKDSVLGKEQTAFRLDVTVEAKDKNSAAVSGDFSSGDIIITGSNKEIGVGDRVIINETD